jgi:UPF0755 protein
MKSKIILIFMTILLSAAAIITFFTWFINIRSNVSHQDVIYIGEKTSVKQLTTLLEEKNIIRSSFSFVIASKIWRIEHKIKPGRYLLEQGMSDKDITRMFKLGLQQPHNLTISGNIRGMDKLSSIIASVISADSATVHSTLTNDSLIASLGFDRMTFPAMFILNTHEIYWTTNPVSLVQRLYKEYRNFWTEERLKKADALNLTPVEISSLASIVAMESNIKEEHPVIAGVYVNRLKRGMPLQADPTIKHALNDPGIKRILYKHLEIDSPYNTYTRKGLPPGPIALPSPSIIDAVLNYKQHNYLYFCASSKLDGTHLFSRTLIEHNRKAREYHRALDRLKLQ